MKLMRMPHSAAAVLCTLAVTSALAQTNHDDDDKDAGGTDIGTRIRDLGKHVQ